MTKSSARKVGAGKAHSTDRKTAAKAVGEKARATYRKTAAQFEEFARDAQMPDSVRALGQRDGYPRSTDHSWVAVAEWLC